MKKYSSKFLRDAHRKSIYHETQIIASKQCACFQCKKAFQREAIFEWTDNSSQKGRTAICPNCGIDSVLPDSLPIDDPEFLTMMYDYWFG